jgi:predicted transcriptional regulator
MKVLEIVDVLSLKVLTGEKFLDRDVCCGYSCDLLSRVMAKGKEGMVWITVQTHMNIVAVASLIEAACIIIPESIEVDQKVLNKAEDEGVIILSSDLTAFELAGKLHRLGVGSGVQ